MGNKKKKLITARIIKTEPVDWKSLNFLQPDGLKELTQQAYGKLRQSLIRNQFVQTMNVWQTEDRLYCLDGYHRIKVMKDLEKEGWSIPEKLPANFIDCKDRKEAIKLILVYSSIYANVTEDGLQELMMTEGLSVEDLNFDIELPQIDWTKFEKGMGRDIPEKEEILRPYKMTHVLLSFPPKTLAKIQDHLKKIIEIEGVEYEQGSN